MQTDGDGAENKVPWLEGAAVCLIFMLPSVGGRSGDDGAREVKLGDCGVVVGYGREDGHHNSDARGEGGMRGAD